MKKLIFYLMALAIAIMTSINVYSQKDKPPSPPPPPFPQKVKMSKSHPENPGSIFYERNPSVTDISWIENSEVVITLKNGNKEKYDLTNPQEMEKFQEKYGIPPPPPPPSPPINRS